MTAMLAATLLAVSGSGQMPFPQDAALVLLTRKTMLSGADIVCIDIDGHDPDPLLMQRLQKRISRAVPGSACTSTSAPVRYRLTGQHGVRYALSNFHADAPGKARASLEVNAGPLAGNWYDVYFVQVDGAWKVVGMRMTLAS